VNKSLKISNYFNIDLMTNFRQWRSGSVLVIACFKVSLELKKTLNKQGIHNDDENWRNEDGDKSFEHIENTLGLVIIKTTLFR
jgi:hypothetical protein